MNGFLSLIENQNINNTWMIEAFNPTIIYAT
jgi:hypothetical protein